MFTFHQAVPDDADQIAEIVCHTSGGVVEHLFGGLIAGLSGEKILSAAFLRGQGAYDTQNVILSRADDKVTGLLFMYPASEHVVSPLMLSFLPSKRLTPVRPILERAIPGSLYINTLWLSEELRGGGHAVALMEEAKSRCRDLGFDRISLFCWNDNELALRFYAREGFSIAEHIPPDELAIVKHSQGGSILCLHLKQ